MKILFPIFALLVMVAAMTACDDDDPVNKTEFGVMMNTRSVDLSETPEAVTFSQKEGAFKIDFTNQTIEVSIPVKLNDDEEITVEPGLLDMTNLSFQYTFAKANFIASGHDVNGFSGRIDMNTGNVYIEMTVDGIYRVTTTNYPCYYNATTAIQPFEGSEGAYTHKQSSYGFKLNENGTGCILSIVNFFPRENATNGINVNYENLPMQVTGNGYKMQADSLTTAYGSGLTLTDVEFTISNNGQILNGTFKCGDHGFTVSGAMF